MRADVIFHCNLTSHKQTHAESESESERDEVRKVFANFEEEGEEEEEEEGIHCQVDMEPLWYSDEGA
jgi:hypothetical protein